MEVGVSKTKYNSEIAPSNSLNVMVFQIKKKS